MTKAAFSGPFLPTGPYLLAGGYARRAWLLGWMLRGFSLLFLALGVMLVADEAPRLRADAAIWNAADASEAPAEFEGRVETQWGVVPSYRGTARFTDPQGVIHEGRIQFGTLFEIDRGGDSVVRYLPDAPARFVHSWAGENLGGRWARLAVMAGFAMLMAPGFWWFGGRWLRQVRLAAAIAVDGREATALLLQVQEHRQYGRVVSRIVRVELGTPDGPRKFGEVFGRKQGSPCMIDERRVLCVVSPRFPQLCIVLREDLYPLELPAGQAEQARLRIAAALQVVDAARNDPGAVS